MISWEQAARLAPGALYIVAAPAPEGALQALATRRDQAGRLAGRVDAAPRGPLALHVERVVGYAADLLLDAMEVDARRARLKEVLAAAGLAELLQAPLKHLRGEELLRVGLAIEALRRPALLVVTCQVAEEATLEALDAVAMLGSAVVCSAPDRLAWPAGAHTLAPPLSS